LLASRLTYTGTVAQARRRVGQVHEHRQAAEPLEGHSALPGRDIVHLAGAGCLPASLAQRCPAA
jgi:hypothetical protein